MKITEIIGLSISEIRYTYTFQNKYDMQEFYAYLRLSNEIIIEIPQYSDSELNQSAEWTREMNEIFSKAKKPNRECRNLIENQIITDIHFCFYEEEADFENKAYLELENGIFVSEENRGPMGLTNIDLEILTKSQFDELKSELEYDFKIKSYSTELKNVLQHRV
uniref:hypothetical protein n=1 Tax=Flavobacterium sp. TaxID=239 RepID=UPI0040493A08